MHLGKLFLVTLRLKRGSLLPRLKEKGALSESRGHGTSRMGIPLWWAPFDFAQDQARPLAAACLTLTVLAFLVTGSAMAAPLSNDHLQELRSHVLSLMNRTRRGEGLIPLLHHEGLEKIAQAHAEDTAMHFDEVSPESREQSYLAHVSSDGRSLSARFRDAGVDPGAEFAENAGYWIREPFGETLEASKYGLRLIHEGMLAEVPPNDSHRQTLLGPFSHVGIGLALLREEGGQSNAGAAVRGPEGPSGPEREPPRLRDPEQSVPFDSLGSLRAPFSDAAAHSGPEARQGRTASGRASSKGEMNAVFLVTDFSHYAKSESSDTRAVEKGRSSRSFPRLPLPTHGGPFLDVTPKDPFAGAIATMKERGIIQGYPDGTFQPKRTVNRAEFLKMILDTTGFSPIGREFSACFGDVFNQWFAPYVCIAKREGWVTGYSDDTFRPEQPVNRAEAVTLLSRILALSTPLETTSFFEDVPGDAWFSRPLRSGASLGFLPFSGKHFQPVLGMQRGEVAEMLYRATTNGGER